MKIDLQKSLENVRKQMGVYTPTAADAGKIDLNKSLETVRTLQQQQQVLTAQRVEEDKRKARKMQTSPLSARAAETLAGLQEGSEIPKLHPTGGPLTVSQDTLRKLGMVNENGFVLGGMDPAKLGLDAAGLEKLGLPTSYVTASGGATFPAQAGKAGVFGGRDYAGYLAGEFGAGILSNPTGILSGAQTAAGDLFTGGQVSEGMQLLANYFAQKPQMLDRWMANERGVEQMIQAETGATGAQLAAYRTANIDDWLRGQLQQATGANLPQGYKDAAGNIAYTMGQQVPGMIYGGLTPSTGSSGVIGAAVDAAKSGSGIAKAAGSATLDALKGNVSTWIMGAGAAGNQLATLAQQNGYDSKNYMNALGSGFAEYFTEGLFGITDAQSIGNIWRNTGDKGANILRAIGNWIGTGLEEGLEEIVNVPMSGIVEKLTTDKDKKLVGEGGIFDLKAMVEAGIDGAIVGMLMGGVGAVTAIRSGVVDGGAINEAALMTNRVIETMPEEIRPATLNPKTATAETLEAKQAEVLEKLQEAAAPAAQGLPQSAAQTAPSRGGLEAGAANQQRVDISPDVNQQGFEQAQNMPVQSNAQAETENADIMETPVEMQEPEEIRNAREMIAQYEANGGALNGQQEGSVFAADGSERQFDQSAGKQARSMESRAVEPESYANQGAVAAARQNRLRNLEPSRTSAEWLNLDKSRFDTRKIKMFPDDLWDSQMQQTAQKAWDKGVEVQFYAGTLRVNGTRVDGINLMDGRVLVQADSQQWSVEQLTDHELMHTYLADEYGLRDEMLRNMEGMDVDRLNSLVASYIAQYNGVIDAMSAMTDEELNDYARGYVIDEIICDAYAGMNRRGWGAAKFSETVRESYDNRVAGRDVAMDQDVRGPPEMRYSLGDAEVPQTYEELIEENEETEGSALTGAEQVQTQGKYPSVSTISVDDLMQLVKGDARKYIPQPASAQRYSVSDETEEDVQELETAEQAAASEPERVRVRDAAQARKELRTDLMNLFSVPAGMRKEAGEKINDYARQILERGKLSTYDRDVLFDILHNYGVMEIPASEYQQTLRGAVKGAVIYVSDEVKAEFGGKEEWNEFRREAFGAGVTLTNDPSRPGWDEWNKEMALLFPGAFDEYETDPAWVLRNIVNVAEQGKSDRMTLAEYAMALSEEYGPEVIDDYYMNMERQMDQLLNNFADKARFETKLRERTEGQLRRDAEYRKDQREKQRETRQLRELQQKTLKQLQFLSKNRHKAPKDLQKQFEEVLSDIDVFAVSAANEMNYSRKYEATWKDLADMYEEARENDPNWLPSKDLERIVDRISKRKLEDFDYNKLRDLYQAALGLRQELYTRRNMLNDNRMFEEVYDQSAQEISESAAGYKGTARDHLMNLEQLTPMNVIERMAGWNPNSAWLSMGKQLEQGERDTKKFVIESNKMLQKFVEENRDWIATADGQGKKAVWIEKEVPELTGFRRGDAPIFSDKRIKIYMTPMMRVQLYMESKSYDNLNHMLGGRRFADKDLYTEAAGDPKKRREALAQGQIVRLTPEMVKYLCEGMSEQEMQLAHILGDLYYNEYSKNEINRVSNVLYGYDKAMSAWYTPIFTDQSFTKKEPGLYDATAEGAGNLKERVNMSTNPSLNLSAMDAFERSVAQTSKFVGMAIPVRNWNTLMNWRGQTDSMKNTIGQKWGDEMQRYLDDLVVRLQNPDVKDETVPEKIISGALSNYISAVFGLNPSVVAKQFGSFYMAMPYLGVNNLPTPKQIHNTDPKLIAKYSPELDDRLMGYAIPEVSQLKKRPNWSQKNKVVEFVAGGGAITAMDGWTAKTLWPWAENKVAKETGLQRGTDEFYKRVAIEFDNAIVRSQSINDIMHRSKLMNSQHAAARAFTMFKTDSAQSYNMLREAFGEAQYMKQHGTEDQKKAANKKAAQAVMGVLANNLWSAAITALINLWKAKGKNYRDDEGELTAASVAAQYSEDVLTSLAGTIIFGEEAADVIANWLGGDKFYGIELAGGDQLSDMVDEIVAAGNGVKEILVDGYYIVSNDGDLGEYFEDRAPDLIGAAKEMAQKAAKYLAGIPVDNLEAYLVGTLRWAAPQAVAAYEDALKSPAKAGLSGLEGKALETRMANILDDRMGGAADETVAELARLYAAGWDDIVPPEDADEIGERTLTPDEQQVYRMSVSATVGRYLDDFISSENYAEMDDAEREQRIGTLYSYAKNVAKQEITGEDPETNVVRIEDLIADGMSIGEALAAYGEYVRADKLLEAGVEPEYVVDTTRAIREAEDANGPDESLNNLERYEIMLEHIGNETTRYAAMAGLMGEKEFARFDSGYTWVDSETYVKFQRAWKETYPDDKTKSQEKAKDLLKSMDLENDERAALWQMCAKNWKPEKNPFDRSIGKEIASEIEAKYLEIDGE